MMQPGEEWVIDVNLNAYAHEVVAATLRMVAQQVRDDQDRLELVATADQVERGQDDACCPMCQEVTCDTGCPLSALREVQHAPMDWREGKTDSELHARFAHPDFEYRTTEGARKQFDSSVPPANENGVPERTWEVNVDAGRDGWERFDYTEEAYWRRRKQP
jgi:hypothetical protein